MNNKKGGAIGIFDSGFGGLNIMKGIVKQLPNYNCIYLGDTARVPYGDRSKKVVYEFTKQAVDFLFSRGSELIIFACNTVSSDALRKIQQEYLPKHYPEKKVLGVIIPTVEHAALTTKNKRIGVIATKGTVKSGAFVKEFLKIDNKVKVFQNACPRLVPIVEAGEQDSKIVDSVLQKYLQPLLAKKIDTLILGCTHYGILENKIKKIVGEKVRVTSEPKNIAEKLKKYLQKHPEIDKKLAKNKKYVFYSTDITDGFEKLGSKFFGKQIHAKKVTIN
jgi:glutamate racemase